MDKNFILKLKRNDGTFSVFALQFNNYMEVKLTTIKGKKPQYNEVLTVLFTHTDIIERIKTNTMKRLNPSRVMSHVGMSGACDLWIEYFRDRSQDSDSTFSFIPSVYQSKKFHISMSNKVEEFEMYIMDIIDIAIELKVINVTENGIKCGNKWIPYLNVTEVAPIDYSNFIPSESKNNVYRMLENFNFDETNNTTEDFITKCKQKVSSMELLDEVEINTLNNIDVEISNEILKINQKNNEIIDRINECLKSVSNNTILLNNDITYLNEIKNNIDKDYSDLVETIIDKHHEIERKTSQIISDIIESEIMESTYTGNMYGEIPSETKE